MKYAILPCLIAAVLLGAPAKAQTPDTSHGWFSPFLTVNEDPDCAGILPAAIAAFGSTDDALAKKFGKFTLIAMAEPDEERELRDGSIVQDDKGRRYKVQAETNIHCGMACDSVSAIVTPQAADGANEKPLSTTEAERWSLYSAGAGKFFLIGHDGETVLAYAVAPASQWKLSCKIALAPDNLKANLDPDIGAALAAANSVYRISLTMSRSAGNCGTMLTADRWETSIEQNMQKAVYRPWALPPGSVTENNNSEIFNHLEDPLPASAANSGGQYDFIFAQLAEWSLGGLDEHKTFMSYRQTIATAEDVLTGFYVRKFGWTQTQSRMMARKAITGAMAGSFGFYEYHPFSHDEIALRRAIFDHAPLTTIEAIPLDADALNAIGASSFGVFKDSVLNIAILYPEALQYLLSKGLDPNAPNAFGKTPLMYAAQYNQLEAAQLLLAAGADANAQTTIVGEQCGWALGTAKMTPLHYAVRYAGSPLIHLLLDHGAQTSLAAEDTDDANPAASHKGTPLTWLERYTSANPNVEHNPNLQPAEVEALKTVLRLPSQPDLKNLARTKILLGEKLAAAGDNQGAYQATRTALAMDSQNQQALSDLPLVALRVGRRGEAAEAATRGTKELATNARKAAAWYNLGLACTDVDSYGYHGVEYNDKDYCSGDWRDPFFQAWKLAPSSTRAIKLEQIIEQPEKNDENACLIDGAFYVVARQDKSVRVYVLHTKDSAPGTVQFEINWADKPKTLETALSVGDYDLSNWALSLLETGRRGRMLVNQQVCGSGR